jgi:hypothetical protein
VVFDVVEYDEFAFEGMSHVGNFEVGVDGLADGDEIARFGRLLQKFTKLHGCLSVLCAEVQLF